jgi:hypothetical protein
MTLTAAKLRSIVNMLADPGSAANAASILAAEARTRGVLVADLIAQATILAPSSPSPAPEPAAPPTAPTWRDVEPIDDGGPYVRRIDVDHLGLVAEVIAETEKAWLVETPTGSEAWLAKSQCQHHGEDPRGRAILIVPRWLAFKIGLRVTP